MNDAFQRELLLQFTLVNLNSRILLHLPDTSPISFESLRMRPATAL